MPKDHPLSEKNLIHPFDFHRQKLLITSESCPYRKKLESVLRETGTITLDTMEIGSMTALQYYVAEGIGIALVPKITIQHLPVGKTTIRPVSGDLIHMSFGLLSRESAGSLQTGAQRLLQAIKQELS